ncbi:MAG: TlpA family protein disulfide reductase [Candidatus Bathyarchaeota archaeon]|nr:TlpA family protein disulfide reductase [Candidatus Bathyarchaeota archaeon]MDH5733285.1 TlpA family protein disulfide reductase [Candidatus Bathyarchaeota archaeon]
MRVKVSVYFISLMIMFLFGVHSVLGQKEAPDFTLVDINGTTFTLSNCSARVVLIDFFATWCTPCKVEIPVLRSLYDEYLRDQLEIISISSENEGTLRNFVQRADINMTWIVACDTAGVMDDYYGGAFSRPIPRTFLVDADGYIRYDHTGWSGAGDELELRSKISSLLSGTENGDFDTEPSGIPYWLIAIVGGIVVVSLIVGIIVAPRMLRRSKPPNKRHSRGRGGVFILR